MNKLKLICAATAIAGFATVAWGGYVSGVRVNGVDVGQTSSGDGWNFDDSHRINLKGSGKTYVITGADTGKRDIRVKIETDCTVVISNLTLAVEESHCNALWLDASKSSLTGTVLFYGVNDLSSGGGAAGIGVKKGQTLNLLGMQATAELHATGGKSGAGIGGDDGVESESYSNCGTVGIFGGKVYATGGRGAAGIGGGGGNIWALGDDAPSVGHGGEVSIFQTSAPVCEVYATGGGAGEMSKQGGAGIGGGSSLRNCNNGNDGQGGSLTVYGGKVVARGGLNAAGIGGAAAANYGGAMSKVEISGGTVEAYGNGTAAGIGGAANSKTGILFHYVQSGGRVKAVGGNNGVPAIGGNDETGCGMMEISGGTVEAASVGDAGPKHFFLVMISGGSVVLTSPNAFGALYAGYADNVEDAVAVFPVRRTGYTSGAAVSINDFKGGTYGVKDIFAVGTSGEVCLWLPRGDYSFAINGATYMPSVDAEGGVTWRTPAKTAKVVVEDGGETLRFVYDGKDYGTKGTAWFSVAEAEAIDPISKKVPWYGCSEDVTKAVFDSSFADYRPTQCGGWFYCFESLSAIEGIGNLDTSAATSLANMFCGCPSLTSLDVTGFDTANVTSMYGMFSRTSLTSLDLSGFDTSKVTDMGYMLYNCSSLETIFTSDAFVTTAVTSSSSMFTFSTKLVGGAGTTFDKTKTDATYARIDGGTSAPGYFTDIADVYKVKFVAGEGTGTMADLICARDKVYNLTKCAFTAPAGKTFKGWAGSNGRRYDDEMLVFDLAKPGETVTMTAIWDIGGVQLWENGPYWAECNVGATKPEEYGYYFWWGDTVGCKRNADDDGWVSVAKGESSSFSSGNCPTYDKTTSELQSAGYIDSTGNLVANYDAATAYLGAPWRMPTGAELGELCSNCTMTWEQQNGVWGRRVTGKGDFASRSIFLPAAGYGDDSYLNDAGSNGRYWSSSPGSDYSSYAWGLHFNSGDFYRNYYSRSRGQSVRPVRGFAK